MINPMDMKDSQMKNFMSGMDNIKFSVLMDTPQQLYFMAKAIEILKDIYDTEQERLSK